jgi:hypothetical protein
MAPEARIAGGLDEDDSPIEPSARIGDMTSQESSV